MPPRGSPLACRSSRVTSVPPPTLPQWHPKTHHPADTVAMEVNRYTLRQQRLLGVGVAVIRVNGSGAHESRKGIRQRRIGPIGSKPGPIAISDDLPERGPGLGVEVQPAREKSGKPSH